jgi:hypothetical protein
VSLARAAFERSPTAPSAAALGGVLAVSSDAVFGNPVAAPGGPAIGRALMIEIWGSRPFGMEELVEAQASAHLRLSRGGVGVGARRFGSAVYHESELRLSGSWEPSVGVGLGLSLRGLSVEGLGFAARRAIAVDAGIRARPDRETEMGVFVEAAIGEIPGDRAGRRSKTAIGVARRLGRTIRVHLEIQGRDDRQVSGVLGMAWNPLRLFSLRAGIREDPFSVTWGFAMGVRNVEVAGSVTEVESLGRTARVGITLGSRRAVRPPVSDAI